MRFLQAFISFAVFGYLGYATLITTLGSSNGGAISRLIANAIDLYGRANVGLALMGFGALLAALFLLAPKREKAKRR